MEEAAELATDSTIDYQDFLLPESLVKLVIKICVKYKVSKYDQFSTLDTLQFALFNDFKDSVGKNAFKDKDQMHILIINMIRLCEKFNNSTSSFTKNIDSVFKELGINKNVYNGSSELEAYKHMRFDIKTPVVLEEIYGLVEKNLDSNEQKNQAFEVANDVLVLVYYYKRSIYAKFVKGMSHEESMSIINNQKLQAVAVFFVVLKILNISRFIELFEKINNELKDEINAKEVNQLCAVIFGLIKNKKSN